MAEPRRMKMEESGEAPGDATVGGERDHMEPSIEYQNPFDFPTRRKWNLTILLACCTLTVTFGSSVFSSTIVVTSAEFHVSETVTILGVALYVLGFAVGPILWGPLSELKGRRLPLLVGYSLFAVIQIPTALATSLPALLVCRMLAGCFGAAPVTLVSAMYADFWAPSERGIATAVYSAAVYIGPTLGPIIGSLLTESRLGWRWTAWITLIMAAIVGIAAFVFVPETYGPILRARATRERRASLSLPPQQEESSQANGFVRKIFIRPAHMMVCEPMLIVTTLYISIVYGILYLTFYAFPYGFSHDRGWDPRIGSLPFLSLLLGVLAACLGVAIYSRRYYQPRLIARRGKVLPEDRLPPMMVGSILLPAGLFWFAWTSSPHIVWVPQVMSAFFIGAGILLIFTNGVAFIVDIYLASAASAMAANTCVRSLVGAGFPLAAPRMYRMLGTAWATSVLGFLCLLVVPAPFLFYRYGHSLRQMSRFAPTPA